MVNDVVKRPPLRDWIPYSTSIQPGLYKVEHLEVVYPIAGLRPMLTVRATPIDAKPPRWSWKKQRLYFEFWVYDTPGARRSLGKLVELKSHTTMDSCFYTISRIVEKIP